MLYRFLKPLALSALVLFLLGAFPGPLPTETHALTRQCQAFLKVTQEAEKVVTLGNSKVRCASAMKQAWIHMQRTARWFPWEKSSGPEPRGPASIQMEQLWLLLIRNGT